MNLQDPGPLLFQFLADVQTGSVTMQERLTVSRDKNIELGGKQ